MAQIVAAFFFPHDPLIAAAPDAAPVRQSDVVWDAHRRISDRVRELEVDTVVVVGEVMSTFAIERALYECTANPANIGRFKANPDEYLSGYALDDQEKAEIKALDVKALEARGSSNMLLMTFWFAVSGGLHAMPEYVRRLNSGSRSVQDAGER